jgi:hypothetical protein
MNHITIRNKAQILKTDEASRRKENIVKASQRLQNFILRSAKEKEGGKEKKTSRASKRIARMVKERKLILLQKKKWSVQQECYPTWPGS